MLALPQVKGALRGVLDRGHARLPQAIAHPDLPLLLSEVAEFVPLEEEVGAVRQSGAFAQLARAAAPPAVQALAEVVEAAARQVAAASGDPLASLHLNEVTYQRYPEGEGHISPHRDQAFYRLLIVVVTLSGSGRFSVLRERRWDALDAEWMTEPGDVVFLRGAGLTAPGDRCPFHAVHPPTAERVSLTLRDNALGPGGGWGGTRGRRDGGG